VIDSLLYTVALLVYLLVPPSFLYWLFVHPLIGLWRRLGLRMSYAVLWLLIAAMVAGLFLFRHQALALHVPVAFWHVYSGGLLLLIGLVMRLRINQDLPVKGLIGGAEMRGDGDPGTLVTGGLYARMRHPRYLQMFLVLLGYALITGYLAIYVIWLLYLPLIGVVILLEERELLRRYGEAYREYRRRVPMLIPHLGRWQE
jgi:protein-S-isoprenylcysteine O-methyltransferase Ste14